MLCCGLMTMSFTYRQTSNIKHTLIGNKIVDHSDEVGASPFGDAPTTSSFSTWHNVLQKYNCMTRRGKLSLGIWCGLY